MKHYFYLTLLSLSVLGCDPTTNEVYNPTYDEGYYILTPKTSNTPRINGAEIFGVRPGSYFQFTVAATGERPMAFIAENLPEGLSIDEQTGIIKGKIKDLSPQNYDVKLTAKNSKGSATENLKIIVGEDITLTPPMGWSSWIATKKEVSQEKVMANAVNMKDRGLDQYGYHYVNIDDAWQGAARGGEFNAIQPDLVKFPDIQGMSDTLHTMGFKFGIYSSPWITTYAKYIGGSSDNKEGLWDESKIINMKNMNVEGRASLVGKYRFDDCDAKQWAAWGVDYMKYDWNPNDEESIVSMAEALRNSGRDIAFSISNSCPMALGDICRRYVQVFRTNGDIRARWNSKREHINLCDNWEHHNKWLYDGFEGSPGHTPDPDFLMVGLQKYGSNDSLTVDQLYHHVSSFYLWGAPLLLSCDLTKLDEFEESLITNVELIDINQDQLSKPGKRVYKENGIEILVKELANGDKAIGIFNFNDTETLATVDWSVVGLEGKQKLRDLWRQKDIGKYNNSFQTQVRPHGAIVVRASKL